MKRIIGIHNAPQPHWVGDGFPVCSLFDYNGLGKQALSPFLLFDYSVPARFEPAVRPRGVGPHPHRGIETVTIVYQGEIEHRDSTGAGGRIGVGDVQWMTAAGGVMHEEFHSSTFTQQGGTIEMVQFWINLPTREKMRQPRYQTLKASQIPSITLPDNQGYIRVIAGEFEGQRGPAMTFTPVDVYDLHLKAGAQLCFGTHLGYNLALVVLRGIVRINGQIAESSQLIHLDHKGSDVELTADTDAILLWLAGEPINEPVVGYGPFVMNTEAEIRQAIIDYNNGRFGRITQTLKQSAVSSQQSAVSSQQSAVSSQQSAVSIKS